MIAPTNNVVRGDFRSEREAALELPDMNPKSSQRCRAQLRELDDDISVIGDVLAAVGAVAVVVIVGVLLWAFR